MQYLGIDLSNTESTLLFSSGERERTLSLATMLCRDEEEHWCVGSEAYEKKLADRGEIADNLLGKSERDGSILIGATEYRAIELLARFLQLAKRELLGEEKSEGLCTVLVLPDYRLSFVRELLKLLPQYDFPADTLRIISREESFLHFLHGEPALLEAGEVGLYALEEKAFAFYAGRSKKEKNKDVLLAETRNMREAFTLEILKNAQGERFADQVLSANAETVLRNRHFASVILTGAGFNRMDWSPNFQRSVSKGQRKLYHEKTVFAQGALRACRAAAEKRELPRFVCKGRAAWKLSLLVKREGQERELVLAERGAALLTAGGRFRFLPEDRRELQLLVTDGARGAKSLPVALDVLPEREDKTCYIDLSFRFSDERSAEFTLVDAGFGEIFPPSGRTSKQEVELWD